MRKEPAAAAFDKINEALRGTTSHTSRWPRTVIPRVEEGGTSLRLYAAQEPHEGPLPALNADEVDRLIAALCVSRMAMTPKVPVKRPAEVPLHVSNWTKIRARSSEVGTVLDIRTDGLSWVSIRPSPAELEALRHALEELSGRSPPETPSPRGGRRAKPARR